MTIGCSVFWEQFPWHLGTTIIAPMTVSSQTPIVSDNNKVKGKDTDIQPVLAQVTQPLVEVLYYKSN